MRRVITMSALLVACLLVLAPQFLRALWNEDGVTICIAMGGQNNVDIVPDGAGGAIMVWEDWRPGVEDIYAQRVDLLGTVRWAVDGIPISTEPGQQKYPRIISDGAGGAIITWQDSLSAAVGDIFAQRIDSTGSSLWTAGGIPVCVYPGAQNRPWLVSDGAGGAIIAWDDYRLGVSGIYAQRVDASGNLLWAADGAQVHSSADESAWSRIVSDGAGGALLVWQETQADADIFAQRIDASGTQQWKSGAVEICTATGIQATMEAVSDDAGGAIVIWGDYRNGVDYDIYAQRVDSSGTTQWGSKDGILICGATDIQYRKQIVSDGSGGAIMVWQDDRNGPSDIYIQRVDHKGNVKWVSDGIPLCTAGQDQIWPLLVYDGAGGAIVTWSDERSNTSYDVYAQRIDTSGTVLWAAGGIPIYADVDDDQYSQCITSDGNSGAIIVWANDHIMSDFDLYALQVDRNGKTVYFPPVIHSVTDIPGDEGGNVNLKWDASLHDIWLGNITEYSGWRTLDPPEAQAMLAAGAQVLPDLSAGPLERQTENDRILRLAPLNGAMVYWELVFTQPVYHFDGYARAVETLFDSTAVCSDYHYFQVIAHTSDSWTYYVSDPDSARSVDNLSPCPPVMLTGEQQYDPAGLGLLWQHDGEPDVGCYRIYRETDEHFIPAPGNLLSEPLSTGYFDDTWSWESGYWYKVAAVDIHGNESGYSVLGPSEITGDDPLPTPSASYLRQNYPNPFNPQTTIAFGLKAPGHVKLSIFNAAGQLVRVLVNEPREARHYEEVWDGRGEGGIAAASGVYFYSLEAGEFRETRKMVLLR